MSKRKERVWTETEGHVALAVFLIVLASMMALGQWLNGYTGAAPTTTSAENSSWKT